MKPEIIPSILSLKDKEIPSAIKILERHFKTLQIDVMDGKFVPNKRFSPGFVSKIKTSMIIEAHLMANKPEKLARKYAKAGAKTIIFHIEAVKEAETLIINIKKQNVDVGIAISPETPINKVLPYLKEIDKLLIMTVHPGEGGQLLIREMLTKVQKARKLDKSLDIEVDGGINKSNIRKVIKAGANHIVVGSALVRGNIKRNIKEFKALIR